MSDLFVLLGQVSVETVFAVYIAGLFLGFCVAVARRSKTGLLAWCAMLFGEATLLSLVCGAEEKELLFAFAVACMTAGAGTFLIFFVSTVNEWEKRRAEKKMKAFRKMEYSLPDQGNEYLRQRLEEGTQRNGEERLETGVDLEYIRSLLVKLKGAKLAAVERMRAEELSKQITVYALKGALTAEERMRLGDCFSSILALAAKYEL